MDVAAWLRYLGLERYVSAFCDNDIDAEVLLKLTAEDLISMGGDLGRPSAQAARRDCQPQHDGSHRRGGGARPSVDGHKSTPNAGS
jgi:hypothetical protein